MATVSPQHAPVANLTAFLDWAARDGAGILEHPAHGGVTPGVHVKNSFHYVGLAADLNWGPPGSPAVEKTHAAHACDVARNFGLGRFYSRHGRTPGHDDHLHVDCGSWFNEGRGETRITGAVPTLTAYHLQGAVNAERDNIWGADTDKRLESVRAASRRQGQTFPYTVQLTQGAVGATPDGVWGVASRAAHDRTVAAIQRALSVKDDGVWGDTTEKAYQAARKTYRR
jgi:hypothetical protein